jgi:hypothetical protein
VSGAQPVVSVSPSVTRPRSGLDCRIGCDDELNESHNLLSKPSFGLPEPRTSLATRTSLAWATLPCALRSFNVLLNLPKLDGAASSGCTRLPLSFFFLLFLLFVVMRLDGEEHHRAQHEQLKRNKDDRNPIHDFLNTLHQQLRQWFKPSWMLHGIPMTILLLVAVTVPKRSPRSQTQICPKTADQMNGMGNLAGKVL